MEKQTTQQKIKRQRGAWTEEKFRARVYEWAKKIGVTPKEIHLRSMKRKWASCSSRGRLTFDTSLLNCKRGFGDYVIAHELLHLQVPNHGKLFKSLMSSFIPNWERYANSLPHLPTPAKQSQ